MSAQRGMADSPSPRGWSTKYGIPLAWALILFLVLIGLVGSMGSTALVDPDEGRNAEIAREMAASGDFILPHLNGLPYLDKPVLLFAAAAASIKALGPTELAARLPGLLFTLATVALVIGFGWRRFDRETGMLAGLMLATSPIVLGYAGIVIFDAPMMFWVSASCILFHVSLEHGRAGWCVAAWAAAGLATLTKGPVGLLLPLLVGLGDALACRQPIRRLFHPAGVIAFVLIVGPWFLAVTLRQPEFPHYAFIRETFERVATDSMRRTGPIYYFLPILLGGAFPWAMLPLVGVRRLAGYWRERAGQTRDEVFLLLWVLQPVLFFSLSQSKRPGYILPVIPAIALLGARLLRDSQAVLRYTAWIAAPLAALLGVALLLAPEGIAERIDAPEVVEAFLGAAPILGAGLLLAAGAALLGARSRLASLVGLALIPVVLLLGSRGLLESMGEQRSARELARVIEAKAPEGVRVVGVGAYSSSLAYYLDRTILLATPFASEMRSNYIMEYLDELRERPGTTLRSLDWWRQELKDCREPTLFIASTRQGWEVVHEALAHLPLLYRNHRFAAYGPCGTASP